MNRKRWFFLITIIIIIVGYIILLQSKDDITKMEKQISKHIKAKQLVLIYNATYIDNHRYMSYIGGEGDKYQQVGYAHFLIKNPSISFFNEENENVIEYNFYNQDGVLIK